MYLLLVDNNFISSREIKAMLDKHNLNCEIINSSSSDSLLDIAEKMAPEIVIIDFDFYIDDSAEIVRSLRQYSSEAYILAFIDPDHYEKLHLAIEMGIDDYMVKPLQRDDVMLRIKLGLQRKSILSVQQVEENNAYIEKDAMLSELEEVFSREAKSDEAPEEHSEKMELETDQPANNNFAITETNTEQTHESQEFKAEEDDFETLSSPALSFLEVQGADETAEEDSDITSDEYDDLEELFGIEPEKYSYQTNPIDLGADSKIEGESKEEDEDKQEKLFAEQTAEEHGRISELFEEKTDEDDEIQPLADFFSEWPDLEEPEESLEEFSAAELAVSSLDKPEKESGQEKEPEAEPEPELERELEHEMEPEPEPEPELELEWEREAEDEPEFEAEIEPDLELETVLENDPYLSEEISDVTDDKELFGMTGDQRNTDKKTFEEIFTRKNGFEAKKSKFSQNEKAVVSKGGQNNSIFPKKISGITQFRRIK